MRRNAQIPNSHDADPPPLIATPNFPHHDVHEHSLDHVRNVAIIRGGMIAPILGGILLMIKTSFPVYTSVVVLALSGVCVLFLSENAGNTKEKGKGREGPSLMH